MKQYKLYEYRNERTKDTIWWTQRDENNNCFKIRKPQGENVFRLYENDIFKSRFETLNEAEKEIKRKWNKAA